MIEPKQPAEKDPTPKPWLLQTVGVALGLAVLMVVIVVVAVLALESPANRRAAVRAAPIDSGTVVDEAVRQTVAPIPTATLEPAPTQTAEPNAELAPTDTSFEVDLPIVANQAERTIARSPTRTPLPTATAVRVSVQAQAPSATRASVPTRTTVQSAPAKPKATSTPILPLELFFYVKAYCHKSGESLQVVDIFLTAHGGTPPYDYYNDTTFIGQSTGMLRYTMKAASGNPVPYKIIILDSGGQRYVKEFFYKTGVHCK